MLDGVDFLLRLSDHRFAVRPTCALLDCRRCVGRSRHGMSEALADGVSPRQAVSKMPNTSSASTQGCARTVRLDAGT